jgi:hypothetical protein
MESNHICNNYSFDANIIKNLRHILTQEDCVLFIGSGISVWSGLPTWNGIIEKLAKFIEMDGGNANLVREEAKKGDLLQAASYGFDKLTTHQIGRFIYDACQYGIARPHEIHRKIIALGPRCYVTTNYDNLIEESLRLWKPDRFFPNPVTNRHLHKMADIVHARSIDFIYKPHGDAGDIDSIILSREQYRQLLPQGERNVALESLKTLMVSRPIVYLGYSLRDPDFFYLRDILANTYKDGIRDHYAIMADVTIDETDYWKRNYGIHLISYPTFERQDKTKDHAALLVLLDSLNSDKMTLSEVQVFDPNSSEVILALARHAASYLNLPKVKPEFQIHVHAEIRKTTNGVYPYYDGIKHYSVSTFLDEGPERTILIGLPGSGKSYSIKQAVARMAAKLNEVCLSIAYNPSKIVIPILIDL